MDRAFAFQQFGFVSNTDPKLTLRVQLVLWGDKAEEDIQEYNDRANIRAPRDYSFVIVRMQVANEGDKSGTYDPISRLKLVSAVAGKDFSYGLGNGQECGEIRRAFRRNHVIDPDHTEQGHVCFLVKTEDAGAAVLLDNGGANAPESDWRFWRLRGAN